MFLFPLLTAPTAAPQLLDDMFVVAATSVTITWNPPPLDEINGMIRSYVVTYFPTSNSLALIKESVLGSVTSFNASGLDPFTNYTFEVVAVTVGPGPPDSIVIQTAEAGESFYQYIQSYIPQSREVAKERWSMWCSTTLKMPFFYI